LFAEEARHVTPIASGFVDHTEPWSFGWDSREKVMEWKEIIAY